jgi:hypothetical protein
MANPFYNALMNSQMPPQQPAQPNPMEIFQKFNSFRQSFQGDAKQKVQGLLSSGEMSQEEFKNLSNTANSFFSMFSNMFGR